MLTVADGERGSGICCRQQKYLNLGQNAMLAVADGGGGGGGGVTMVKSLLT